MKGNLDIGTFGGIVFGLASVFGSFALEGGEVGGLVLVPAMVIVLGGTIAAAMIGTKPREFSQSWKLVLLTLFPPRYDIEGTIDGIVRYSNIARKDGLLVLEKELPHIENSFLRKIIRFAIDGTDSEALRSIGETEVRYVSERHSRGASIFQKMGGYSPTMGIIGTVMGLIATLASAGQEPNVLIRHIAGAFIATLWGVFMANLVWLPIADKLRSIHNDEELYMDLIVEGVVAIQKGEIPLVIKAKLNSMLPTQFQEFVL